MIIQLSPPDRAKQIAGWLRKHFGIQRQRALNLVVTMHGYENWDHLLTRWKRTQPRLVDECRSTQ